jgi:hypothetical protein
LGQLAQRRLRSAVAVAIKLEIEHWTPRYRASISPCCVRSGLVGHNVVLIAVASGIRSFASLRMTSGRSTQRLAVADRERALPSSIPEVPWQ